MRGKRSTTMFVSGVLALALSLSACATDDDDPDGGTLDPGNGVTTTTPDPLTPTTIAGTTTTP